MTSAVEIRVESYDGHRARVRPRAVLLAGERLEVVEIEDSWISTGVDPRSPVCYGFVVRCVGGARFRLTYVEERGWQGELLPGPRSA